MLSIPVSVNSKIYYIAIIPKDELTSLQTKASTYDTIVNIINFSISTISPSDITISDLKNFRIDARSDSLALGVGESTVSEAILDSNTKRYYYNVTHYNSTTSWSVNYSAFSPNDLSNIGVILSKLISQAHSHSGSTGSRSVTAKNCSHSSCCNSTVIW